MVFPILGGNGAVAGFSIDNSLRFNDNDSARLSRTPSSAGNRKTWTWSCWIKRGNIGSTLSQNLLGSGTSGTASTFDTIRINADKIQFFTQDALATLLNTDAVYRDVSAWYHIIVAVDTTQATSSNRVKIYVNGLEQSISGTYPSLNEDTSINNNISQGIGARQVTGALVNYFDGYMAEINFIDGQQLDASSFGEFDEDSGIWKPISYSGSYGTNGFYLDFENSGSLGADQSGNGNNFTPTNLASTDQTTDTPTNNFATMNPLARINGSGNTPTFSEGNLQLTTSDATSRFGIGSITTTGKYYFEAKITSLSASDSNQRIGIISENSISASTDYSSFYQAGGVITATGESNGSGSSWSVNDIIGVAVDMADSNTVKYYLNGSLQATMSVGASYQSLSTVPATRQLNATNTFQMNFGNPPFSISSGNSDGNGYGNFEYAPPSGYLALCTQNLATALSPTIDDGSAYFQTAIWSGTGASHSIVNDGNSDLQPDMIWFKSRSTTYDHRVYDSTRGTTVSVRPNTNDAENTLTNGTISYDTDGFTLGTAPQLNASGQTYVGWQWKASGGTTSSNTSGSITSTVQANTTAGFSIVTYTGTGTAGTIGHGLGKKPQCILLKNRSFNDSWITFHEPEGATKFMSLDTTGASDDFGAMWNDTEPTTSVFGIGSDSGGRWVNSSGDTYVAYCFAGIEGYSKMGKYTGNGSTDGTFVYTGFRPAWVIIKRTDSAGNDWIVIDTKRFTYNQISSYIRANTSDAETDQFNIDEDIVSNGFKIRGDSGNINASGSSYIYMAFAESPFVTSSGVPVVAR